MMSAKFPGSGIQFLSAGTRARTGMAMTQEAALVAIARGAEADRVRSHAARFLTEEDVRASDLVLSMAREHRRAVVELEPAAVRRAFTLLELSRLLADLSDAELINAAAHESYVSDARGRFMAMVALLGSRRGLLVPPSEPTLDDVVDPYRRSMQTYEHSADQLMSALPAVERLIKLAIR